ncbi:hypothetical protein [Streptomyces sp. SM11]|uniref:hypothetical protein n=1 Tax=Streptomyces sp. SM11 TaxID=565557 RepID=UPI000CD4E588|nr:hypothetical protein [Streptomyces sp. SM11]
MDQLVNRTGSPADLMDLYRGWACLPHPGEQVLERELFRTYGWDWPAHHLSLRPTSGTRYRLTAHDPRSGTTHHHTAELRPLGPRPVLIGCDRTAGEVQRYTASLHPRTPPIRARP